MHQDSSKQQELLKAAAKIALPPAFLAVSTHCGDDCALMNYVFMNQPQQNNTGLQEGPRQVCGDGGVRRQGRP
jgi:hypothetical protein